MPSRKDAKGKKPSYTVLDYKLEQWKLTISSSHQPSRLMPGNRSMEHELLLIKSFVTKERQERYATLISTEKGRQKFKMYLSHFKDLNTQYCSPIPSLPSYLQLYDLLKSSGAPNTCYVICENLNYDMKLLPLIDATRQLFNSGLAFFLSCIPGKLGYYEGEDSSQQFILKHN
jgi:hypothetical protein